MKKLRILIVACVFLLTSSMVKADEGMWLLSMLQGYTIEDMQKEGFKLSAEDIYSVNEACLKDAVVIFGGGCTGELISNEGLLLTNHHCGYGAIQRHSSVEHDYLTEGFWAMNKEEELPNKGLSVQFLRYLKDVTDVVNEGTIGVEDSKEIESIKRANIQKIMDEAMNGNNYEANVKPMFYGNQYFLFVYEKYMDVRLVGAPPSTIGNFGEDTDNWVWPRHTGDFSIFRIYANENNEPAIYSADNVPYKPRKFFEISTDGVKEGDFTMVLGYPGSTQRFLYSKAIETMMETSLPLKIALRTERLEIMDKYMKESDVVRIQYASKYRGVSNAWKKWQGAIKGLERLDAIAKKQNFENEFNVWLNESGRDEQISKYGELLNSFEEIYTEMEAYQVVNDLVREAVLAVEVFKYASTIESQVIDSVDAEKLTARVESLYKDYYEPIDLEMFASMMKRYFEYADEIYYPEMYAEIVEKCKGDFDLFAEKTFDKSVFGSKDKALEFVAVYAKNPKKAMKTLAKDPVLNYLNQFRQIYGLMVLPQMEMLNENLDKLYKIWVQANFEFQPEKRQYPDANFTMRLTYGKIDGYKPEDAVRYDYFTTLAGVIEKGIEGRHDHVVPEKLEELYYAKDYGSYGVDGTMPVCFAASNHTSGGNSGSPVLDDSGRLIGINFDRNWHGTMSDEMYDPNMCRNISVDIRYVLFIIDKYAGAGYLLDEMVLVNE